MLEYGNIGMAGISSLGRGTRLRAYGAEACAAPRNTFFTIPLFLFKVAPSFILGIFRSSSTMQIRAPCFILKWIYRT